MHTHIQITAYHHHLIPYHWSRHFYSNIDLCIYYVWDGHYYKYNANPSLPIMHRIYAACGCINLPGYNITNKRPEPSPIYVAEGVVLVYSQKFIATLYQF